MLNEAVFLRKKEGILLQRPADMAACHWISKLSSYGGISLTASCSNGLMDKNMGNRFSLLKRHRGLLIAHLQKW